MAGGFGLLHGMGFASALSEAGLPSGEIPLAVFSFNVGIELGQLTFVGIVLVVRRALRVEVRPWLARASVYAMGGLAAYWCLERAVAL